MSQSFAPRVAVRRTGAIYPGFRPIRDLLPQVVAMACQVSSSVGTAPALPTAPDAGLPFTDKQAAVAHHGTALTGRHRPPTWGPTPSRQWGGEGTQSRAIVAPSAVGRS